MSESTESNEQTWTITSLARTTRALFEQRKLRSPRLDAELLLGHVLELTRTQLYMYGDREVSEPQRELFRELVKRRLRGEPIAYLLGTRGFWKFDLRVDKRVLIPRPETELLVEQALAFAGNRRQAAWKVVDVGTGSGALALALAHELPNATVVAIDVSADALAVAGENATTLGLRDRVKLVRGDLLEPIVRAGAKVHVVVSNPPYVGHGDGAMLEAEVREFEPAEALFAGDDGLSLIRKLVVQAAAVLEPGGVFLCEFGANQGAAVAALAAPHFGEVRIERDLAGLDRMLFARAAGELALPIDAPPPTIDVTEDSTDGGGSAEETDPEAEVLPVIDIHAR